MTRKGGFDGVIIETTGLADPAPVVQTFFVDEDVRGRVMLDSVVTVVDARHFLDRVEDSHEAEEQVAFADTILLNKTDLVDAETLAKVRARVRAMNKFADLHETTHARIGLDRILDRGSFDLERPAARCRQVFRMDPQADHRARHIHLPLQGHPQPRRPGPPLRLPGRPHGDGQRLGAGLVRR
jgi:G3E family GTPase